MAHMLQAGVLPGWTTPVSAGVTREILMATATEPLVFDESEARIDPARFLDRVLLLAEAEGRA